LDDLVAFLRRYGRLIGAGDVLRSVQFHEIIYERLFSAKGLDPKALGLEILWLRCFALIFQGFFYIF
jgi:hypothetical protein